MSERVFDDFDVSGAIDQCHVNANRSVLTQWHPGEVFASGVIDALQLAQSDPFHRTGEITGLFDFDENQPITVLRDQVNFTTLAAPPVLAQGVAAALVFSCDLMSLLSVRLAKLALQQSMMIKTPC